MNAPRLKLSEPPPQPRPDPITTWLDTLSMVLRLPRQDRQNVRDELAGHLNDRVRDLMLAGVPEAQAAQTALEELGPAVHLAQRLQAASRTPARRLAMNLTVLGVASAALITSVIALRTTPTAPPGQAGTASVMPATATPAIPDEVEKIRITTKDTETWQSFFKQVADKSKLPVDVRWRQLEQRGHQSQDVLPISFRDTALAQAIKIINEETAEPGQEVDYRVLDNRIVFATQDYFDKLETVLVAYDLSKQVADRASTTASQTPPPPSGIVVAVPPSNAAQTVTSEVRAVLQHMVHPEGWQDNGGEVASMAVFGSKLFIKAPKRYHTEIQWVIDELPKNAEAVELFERVPQRTSIDARTSIPVLGDLPILNNQFRTTVPVGQPATITPAPEGARLNVTSPAGTIKADEVRITNQPTDPASASPAPQPPRR